MYFKLFLYRNKRNIVLYGNNICFAMFFLKGDQFEAQLKFFNNCSREISGGYDLLMESQCRVCSMNNVSETVIVLLNF